MVVPCVLIKSRAGLPDLRLGFRFLQQGNIDPEVMTANHREHSISDSLFIFSSVEIIQYRLVLPRKLPAQFYQRGPHRTVVHSDGA